MLYNFIEFRKSIIFGVMNVGEVLGKRIYRRDIDRMCRECCDMSSPEALKRAEKLRRELLALSFNEDDRTAYNALWVLTSIPATHRKWLEERKSELIDLLLHTQHNGKRRLLLTLLEGMKMKKEDIRTDYLDFCLSGINSTEPYAIRALCLKQAFALCRHFPELLAELMAEIEMMEYGEMSPGLRCARKNVLLKIAKLH